MRTLHIVLAALVCSGAAFADSPAVDAATPACRARPALPEGRPRIGLALGGGGARGIAHISVLRTLESLHVPIDCIAGTSMGSLVGALYASGMSLDDMETLVLGMDWQRLFDDRLARPEQTYRRKRDDDLVLSQPGIGIDAKGVQLAPGLLAGERILLTFAKLVEPVATIEHFDDLPIPFRAIAADINTGEAVIIAVGDLALAMRASMSIPGAFPPVEMNGRVLVDGGVAQNLPVDAVRAMGADIVIAVDVGTPLAALDVDANPLKVADQLIGLLTVGNTTKTIAALDERDILIRPPLGERVATADFQKGQEALAIGLEGVATQRSRLAALAVEPAAYAQNVAVRQGRQTQAPVIAFVRLDNRSTYSDAYVLDRVQVSIGQPLDSARLEEQLFALYGSRTLSLATYEVVEENGQTGIVLHTMPKVHGPNYLEVGLSVSSDYDGRFDFGVRLGILRSPFNDSGGEWRAMAQLGEEMRFLSEVYQPMGKGGRYFLFGRGEYRDEKFDTYGGNGSKLAEYSVEQIGALVGAGREFGNHGALSLGYRRAVGQSAILIGDPDTPDLDFDIGEAYVDLSIDRLDSLYFPRDGYLLRNRYVISREALGADSDFEQYDLDGLYAHSFGAHVLQAGVRFHTTVSGSLPLQSRYRLGGFSRLVGYQPNELSGQHHALLLGGYSYRVAEIFNQPALLGFTLEYGNAWEQRHEIAFEDAKLNASAYIGLDSWIGPILFGVGGREGGGQNVFLEVGHRF